MLATMAPLRCCATGLLRWFVAFPKQDIGVSAAGDSRATAGVDKTGSSFKVDLSRVASPGAAEIGNSGKTGNLTPRRVGAGPLTMKVSAAWVIASKLRRE